jgi:hypothetical protein
MKKTLLIANVFALVVLAAGAQTAQFLPKHLAVLRAGDGVLDLGLKQSPVFIDQFDTNGPNSSPSFTVQIATNGPDTLFFNGHAATEGTLTRSADHKLLSFAGYGGVNLLQSNGTPSLLGIKRAFCTVDAAGKVRTTIYRGLGAAEKMNPRGVVTDGTNNFWGCGNANGTVFFDASNSAGVVEITAMPSSRAVKLINNILYASINGPDGIASDQVAGIFSFEPPLPRSADASLKLVVPAAAPYTKNIDFDIGPDGATAYMSDAAAGIQKYVKSGATWKLAYNFAIPQQIAASGKSGAGCFGLVVDFSGAAPVIYATTTEGYGGSVNSNRVVRIIDTNASAMVTTIAQATSTNIAFRGIEFTPEMAATKP